MKTVLTLEFAVDEMQLIIDVLALIAAARNDTPAEGKSIVKSNPGMATRTHIVQKETADYPSRIFTHDDIRDLMPEVMERDEDNRPEVLRRMEELGANRISEIAPEDVADFYEFLRSLKDG